MVGWKNSWGSKIFNDNLNDNGNRLVQFASAYFDSVNIEKD